MEGIVYTLPFSNLQDGNAQDTFKTMAAIIVSATEGYQAELLGFWASASADAAVDECYTWDIRRIADVSAGGAGTTTAVTVGNMPRQRSNAGNPDTSGGVNYTGEPTTYESYPLWEGSLFDRGQIGFMWPDGCGPLAIEDQIIGLRVAPRAAGPTQLNWSGCLFFRSTT
jgi:hypothetical protein